MLSNSDINTIVKQIWQNKETGELNNLFDKLIAAVSESKKEDIKKVKKQISSTDDNKNTLLHIASKIGHVRAVKELMSLNGNIVIRQNNQGKTALHLAVEDGKLNVINVLYDYSYYRSDRIVFRYCSPGIRKAASWNAVEGLIRRLELIKDQNGNTIGHIAVSNSKLDILKKCDAYTLIGIRNNSGKTALDLLVANGLGIDDKERIGKFGKMLINSERIVKRTTASNLVTFSFAVLSMFLLLLCTELLVENHSIDRKTGMRLILGLSMTCVLCGLGFAFVILNVHGKAEILKQKMVDFLEDKKEKYITEPASEGTRVLIEELNKELKRVNPSEFSEEDLKDMREKIHSVGKQLGTSVYPSHIISSVKQEAAVSYGKIFLE